MVLRTAIAVLCLVLPAAAAGQVAYAEDQTLVTTGAAELLYLVDADGDGDLDVWAGPETAGGPIDLHEQSGPGAFTARALTVPEATYTHWAPCDANDDPLRDLCYGNSAVASIYFARALALGSMNATSTSVATLAGSSVRSLRPMKLAAVAGDQVAFTTAGLQTEAADPRAAPAISRGSAVLAGVLDIRTGDVDGDGSGDMVGLRAGDVQVSTNGGLLGVWNPALTFAVTGAVDATVADLVAGGSRELVIVTSNGTAFLVNDATGAGTVSQLLGVQNAVAVTTLDADLDGDLDLAFAVRPLGIGAGVEIWENDGAGAFTLVDAVSTAGGTDVPTAIAAGDLVDADGKPELALALGGLTHQVVIFAGANLPPRITATGALPSPVPEGDPVTLSATASTPELGQALTYEFFDEVGTSLGPPSASSSLVITAPPICGATVGATQLLTYRVDVSDGVDVSSLPISLTVSEAVNAAPVIDDFPLPPSIDELATISVTAVAQDDCPGQPLTYTFTATGLTAVPVGPDGVDLTAADRICADGSAQVRVRVTDVLGAFDDSGDLSITINDTEDDPPVLAAITPVGPLAEGTQGTFTVALAQPDDCPAQLVYQWIAPPGTTIVSGQDTDQATFVVGRICGDQDVVLAVTVRDLLNPAGPAATLPLRLVESINDPPVLSSIDGTEPLIEATPGAGTYGVTASDLDCTVFSVAWRVVSGPATISGPTGGPTVLLDTSSFLGCGDSSVDLEATVTDEQLEPAVLQRSIPVTWVNEAPTLTGIDGLSFSLPEQTAGAGTYGVTASDPDCGPLTVAWSVVGPIAINGPADGDSVTLDTLDAGCIDADATVQAVVTDPQGLPSPLLEQQLTVVWVNDPPSLAEDPATSLGPVSELSGGDLSVLATDDCTPVPDLTYFWQSDPALLTFDNETSPSPHATIVGPLCGSTTADVSLQLSDNSLTTSLGPYQLLLTDDVPSTPAVGGTTDTLREHVASTVRFAISDPDCPVTPTALACTPTLPDLPLPVACTVVQNPADPHAGFAVFDLPALEGLCPDPAPVYPFALSVSGDGATTASDQVSIPVIAFDDPPVFAPDPLTYVVRAADPLVFDLTAPVVTEDCNTLTYEWSVEPPGRISFVSIASPTVTAANRLADGADLSLGCVTDAQVLVKVTDGAGGEATSSLDVRLPALDLEPPYGTRLDGPAPLEVTVDGSVTLDATANDDCGGELSFDFSTESTLVSLRQEGNSVVVSAARCTEGGPAWIVAVPTDGVHEGPPAEIEVRVEAAPAVIRPPAPLRLVLDGSPIDTPVVVEATCVPQLCFTPSLPPEAGGGCGGPDRRLRIPAEALSSFLPPQDRLTYAVSDPALRAEEVRVDVQFIPSDDLLRLSHATDRGRLGPGETATLTIEIASRLLGPIEVPVVIEDSLLGLSLVEGTARITGATLVEAIGTGGGAEFTVTDLPPAGGTATLTFLVTRSLASDGVVTSNVIARAVDRAPLSRRDGTAAAGLDLGAAPGIACSCTSGGAEGGGWALFGLLIAALLAAPRSHLPRR